MQLQSKILLLLIPLIILPILILGRVAYSLLIEDAHNRTRYQMTALLEQIESQTASQLRTARANASLFASTSLVKQYIEAPAASADRHELKQQVMDLLFNYQLAYPEYYEIRIISRDGTEQLRSVLGNVPNLKTNEVSSSYFIAAGNNPGITYTTFFRNPDNDKPALLASKPLFLPAKNSAGREKELYGYLMLTIDPGFLEIQANNRKVAGNGEIFFTDDVGTILFHPSPQHTGKQLPPGIFIESQLNANGNTRIDGQYKGKDAHFRAIKLHDWLYAFGVYQEDELLAKSIDLGWKVALITSFAILLASTFLFGTLRKLLITPIRKLSLAASEMGRGHVLVAIDIDSSDEIGELATTFREMGKNLNHYHEQVRYITYHDKLTGLPNRAMLNDYLNRAIAEARRDLQGLGILFLDIDNFKLINETLGQQNSDRLLAAFADRISKNLRETDVVSHQSRGDASRVIARQEGDEFIVLLPGTGNPREVQKVASRILKSLSESFVISIQELYVSASIGIAMYPEDGETAGELLENAATALSHAKDLGRNNFQYYSGKLNEESAEKLKIEGRLRQALENNRLELLYQPQVNLATGRISGAEAQFRWEDAELGEIPPAVFLPVAEESGLTAQLSKWLINKACSQAQQWTTAFQRPVTMSIKLPAVHFSDQGLEDMIAGTLKATGLDPAQLELELAETVILQDLNQAAASLEAFKYMGLQLTLDNFGSGYSSLGHLLKLPFDKLRIDPCFIRNLKTETRDSAMVAAIISMSHNLGMAAVAAGVERQEHMQILQQMRCDHVQGPYISRPLTAESFATFITQRSKQSA